MRLGAGYNSTGAYESPVHDSSSIARWGRYDWRAELCGQCNVKMETRSGNSSRPDRTWSEWAEVATNQIKSPNARYLQWRVELSGNPGTTPVLESVTASYLPQNTAPVVRSISVMLVPPTASASKTATQQQQQSQTATFSVTVTDTADPLPATSSGTPSQILSRGGAQGLQLSWQAMMPTATSLSMQSISAERVNGNGRC